MDDDDWELESNSEEQVEAKPEPKAQQWSESPEREISESESMDDWERQLEAKDEEEEVEAEPVNIWRPDVEEDNWEEEEEMEGHYRFSPSFGVRTTLGQSTDLDRQWERVETELDQLLAEEGDEIKRQRHIFSTMYNISVPVWEVVGEDRHVHFVVDLDSFLCDLIEAPQLDFEHGLQVLSATHLLERRLELLRAGGRRPMMVAFDFLKCLWVNRPDIMLIRQILILHIQSLEDVCLFRFPNFWCKEWITFVGVWLPTFCVVSAPGCKNIPQEYQYIFEAFITYIQCCLDIPIVYSSTLNFKSNALLGHKLVLPHGATRYCRKKIRVEQGLRPLPLVKPYSPSTTLNEGLWNACCNAVDAPDDQFIVYACACYLQDQKSKDYVALTCLGHVLSKMLPLHMRRLVLHDDGHKRLITFMHNFYPNLTAAVNSYSDIGDQINNTKLSPAAGQKQQHKAITFLTDLTDGRLLHFIAQSAALVHAEAQTGLPKEAMNEVTELFAKACKLSGVDLELFPILEMDDLRSKPAQGAYVAEVLETPEPFQCIQLQNDFVKTLFASLDKDLDSKGLLVAPPVQEKGEFWHRFEENDWQPSKKVKDVITKHPPAVTKQEKRSAQRYLAFIEKYSQSLQPGKIVLRDVIVAKPSKEKDNGKRGKKGKGKQKGKGKKGKKGRGGGKKKVNDVRERARLEVEERQRQAKVNKTNALIKRLILDHPDSSAGLERRIVRMDKEFLSESDPDSALPGLMQLRQWCEEAALKSTQVDKLKNCVRLWHVSHDIFRRFGVNLNLEQCRLLQRSLLIMGYNKAAGAMAREYVARLKAAPGAEDKPLPTTDAARVDPKTVEAEIAAPPSYPRFQLRHCGEFMVRSVDSAYDPRVSGFYPDAWQRDLLDVVDHRGSALVVAPTSSGKTFVSWYAMKQTLAENKKKKAKKDKRRIVYVCPTKALVQQAAAEVYAKYGDVFGIFTSDWDHKVLESEVTVVVPDTFEIILSSHARQDFVDSIDYVIFDEVHCLDEGDGGEVWERLFMLCRCPFIALSATVGEPKVFQNWLTRIGRPFALSQAQKTKKGETKYQDEIQLIHHHLRWSDLQKYIYCPSGPYVPPVGKQGTTPYENGDLYIQRHRASHSWQSACIPLHPGAAVAMTNGLKRFTDGFPPSLSFSPSDSLRLFNSMEKQANASNNQELIRTIYNDEHPLLPEKHFNDLVITKRETKEWEHKLKTTLWRWVVMGYYDVAQAVLDDLASKPVKSIKLMEDAYDGNECYTFEFVKQNITKLLIDLENQDRLPVLIFCLDRTQCEQLLAQIVQDLEDAEEAFKKATMSNFTQDEIRQAKKNEKEIKKIKKQIAGLEKSSGRAADSDARDGSSQKNDSREQIETLEEKLATLMGESVRDANTIDERFTFMKNGETMTEEDMEFWKKRTIRKSDALKAGTSIKMRCLQRGVGLHHKGLSTQYRQFVETLFRAKHLKAVITTATLAMGVNMPARSVVFAGDHPDFNPLAYRQMMGRAGRRGYDNIGHVTFLGIRPRKAAYLMTSQLTSLTGHYPITPGMCLRVAQQYETFDAKGKEQSIIAFQNVMTPAFDRRTVDKIDSTPLLKQNARFMMEYLYHFNFLNENGACHSLAGVATHLMRYEPANLIFVKMIETGLFHTITKEYDSSNKNIQEVVCRRLLLVLCHIFSNSICLPPELAPPNAKNNYSKAALPSLKGVAGKIDVAAQLDKLDRQTFSLYEHFCRSMGDLKDCNPFTPKRTQLPLSKVSFVREKPTPTNPDQQTLLSSFPESGAQVCSHFAALADPHDHFTTQRSILECGREDMIFERKSITGSETHDLRGRKLRKNGFAYNFYCGEDYYPMLRTNYLRDGLGWSYLKWWQLLLKDIKHSLRAISGLEHKMKEAEQEQRRIASLQESATYVEVSHKYSVYKGAKILKDAHTGEFIKVLGRRAQYDTFEVQETEKMIDPLVQAFSFLAADFEATFKNIEHGKG